MMTDQRKALDRWLSQFPDEQICEFECPHCETQIGTLKPELSSTYSSVTQCPDCSEVFFKVVREDGEVTTSK